MVQILADARAMRQLGILDPVFVYTSQSLQQQRWQERYRLGVLMRPRTRTSVGKLLLNTQKTLDGFGIDRLKGSGVGRPVVELTIRSPSLHRISHSYKVFRNKYAFRYHYQFERKRGWLSTRNFSLRFNKPY